MDTVEEWKTLENEDVTTEGFLILSKDGNNAYVAPASNSLFPNKEKAADVLTEMIRKGMPIGFAEIVSAKLLHKRNLQVKSEEPPKLVILDGQG